ncbi:LegC family aminotransferase [Sediminibacterium sp. KACHI17]|uniref:LegC family aminotransferase n=1 Tax=Sediminibacterium sp. KACHI17 TaxID=1751071 RepID=A0AAT9GIH4_9BACT
MFEDIIDEIRRLFKKSSGFIPLHEPRFQGNESKYVVDAITSTFVSSVGQYVDQFEDRIAKYTGARFAIATVNGTAALHIALILAGVKKDELVITQSLSFIATCNAISYIGADPLFIDIDKQTLGMSSVSLSDFLESKTEIKDNNCYHIPSGKRIAACVPMHTFGHPVDLEKITELCKVHKIPLVEDAAESIGSRYKGKHTGTFGLLGTISLNGNKTITSGGGGAILTDDEYLAKLGKHLTTQSKIPHRWEFDHDMIGYNYRMPNINAALACAQLEQLDSFVESKRRLSEKYNCFFKDYPILFMQEPKDSYSNYWLNAIILSDKSERDAFLEYSNDQLVMTRPVWRLMHKIKMFSNSYCEDMSSSEWVSERLVNIPSSVIL